VLPARGEDKWVAVVTGPTSPISEGELARMVASDEPAAAAAGLHAAGVAAAPVQPTHELGHDPQLVASGFWQTMDRRYVGLHTLGAPPFRFDGRRPDTRGPAPTLGEHTEEVLAGARVK
jgi:crotonobetainyl-CoA:carnitine CoA-transferase CaiB-like acyl-CoA transferase